MTAVMTEAGSGADVSAIVARPYARVLIPGPEGGYSARVIEFPGCFSEGDTPEVAMTMLEEALELYVRAMIEDGDPILAPFATPSTAGGSRSASRRRSTPRPSDWRQ